jgi:hypothetical protein
MNEKTDKCLKDTLFHIKEVGSNIYKAINELVERARIHDNSKLENPELEIFANAPDLSKIEYGSKEYKDSLEFIKPAIEHHYACNRHHAEHWKNGIEDMSLIDLVEMLADWSAATKRQRNGNLLKSIEINSERYKISPQLRQILENTARELYE